MARWKVTSKHYLYAEQFGQPTEWAREEINTDTGRVFRKTLKVPMLIDPDDRFCINRTEGFCVVAHKGSEKSGDIVFEGPPTMDMEPLDDEARAISEKESKNWIDPIQGLPATIGEEFGSQLLRMMQQQLDAAARDSREQPMATSLKGMPSGEVNELKKLLEAQQRQIDALLSQGRPSLDDGVKLENIDPDAMPQVPPTVLDKKTSASVRRA